jgi:hypothetical protein
MKNLRLEFRISKLQFRCSVGVLINSLIFRKITP